MGTKGTGKQASTIVCPGGPVAASRHVGPAPGSFSRMVEPPLNLDGLGLLTVVPSIKLSKRLVSHGTDLGSRPPDGLASVRSAQICFSLRAREIPGILGASGTSFLASELPESSARVGEA